MLLLFNLDWLLEECDGFDGVNHGLQPVGHGQPTKLCYVASGHICIFVYATKISQ